ncbi:MAG TPA: alpha/beta hydrolase, partial [Xanthobacteraceae bacterium]|nr:alpha/beta hydrolase [Xanthobacteraceae bacterium]
RTLEWNWRGETLRLGADASGSGPKVLLLPALSSISSRREMHPLQERLAPRCSTLAVDWPGFGDAARPQMDWTPDAYTAFVAFLLNSVVEQPHAIIAAGHAATYVLKHMADASPPTPQLVLIAPTWRGPLPTMLGGHRPFFDRLCRLVDRPGIGPLIYRLNVNRLAVRYMGAGHVYADPAFLAGERLREKLAVVRAPGARFASVRFVTGRLDPLASRATFLDLARRAAAPVLLIYGAETPPKSRAEMEALAAVPGVRTVRLPKGKLSVHEEFPDATMQAIAPFLTEEKPSAATG